MVDELASGSADQQQWSSAQHMFDYNLDHLGLGTIDSPHWKIADRKMAYVDRAVVARAGLWGSLTMYDAPKFYLVANPINRYSIGDRSADCATTTTGRSPCICNCNRLAPTRSRTGCRLPRAGFGRSCVPIDPDRPSWRAPTDAPTSVGRSSSRQTNRSQYPRAVPLRVGPWRCHPMS